MFRKYFFMAVLCTATTHCFADNYPRNYSLDIIHYAFELKLSDSTDEIQGRTSVSILFKTNDTKQIRLDLINNTTQRAGKGMTVASVTYNNQALEFIHQNDALLIKVGSQFEKNNTYTFVINYYGIPADGLRIGPTKYGDRSFFNENWPNRARHWLPTVDHPYDKATNEFIITAPRKYKVISNGLLIEESTINTAYKLSHWKQSVPVSCWLFVLGVAEFAVQHVGDFDGKSIETWVYPKDREAGFYDFAKPTHEVLKFYTAYVGPFVYEKLANIQSPSVGGGMETSSAIFYGENLVNGKADKRLKDVVIHEIAHQWFGNAVTETTWDDVWLSEGFATFFTLLFQEYEYGHEEYINGLKRSRKTIFDFYKKDSTYSIIDDRSPENGPVTNNMTYQKGAWVLHMLRERIGHEKFKEGIRNYYQKFMNANATTYDFIKEMEKVSNENLQTFFNQWLYKPGYAKINALWEYDAKEKQIIFHVMQSDSMFETPIEFQIYNESSPSPQNIKFDLKTKTTEYKIPSSIEPTLIVADPRTVLLATIDLAKK